MWFLHDFLIGWNTFWRVMWSCGTHWWLMTRVFHTWLMTSHESSKNCNWLGPMSPYSWLPNKQGWYISRRLGHFAKNMWFSIKNYQKHLYTNCKLCYIKSCLYQKTFLSKVVRICTDYTQVKGFPEISTTGLLNNFSAPYVFFKYFSVFFLY